MDAPSQDQTHWAVGKITELTQGARLLPHAILPRDPVEVALTHAQYALERQGRMLHEMDYQMNRLQRMVSELIRKPCCCKCHAAEAKHEESQG